MKRISLIVALVVIMLGIIAGGFVFGRNIEFSKQWPLYEALRTTASIIFAVIGAWLAIIYPERLKLTFRAAESEKDADLIDMRKLLSPAINSTAILCVVLLIGVIAPILRQVEYLYTHKELMRGISYAVLISLTVWQLWTIVLTMVPADALQRNSDQEILQKKAFMAYKNHS